MFSLSPYCGGSFSFFLKCQGDGSLDIFNTDIVLSIVGGKDGFLELSKSNEALEGLDIPERSRLSDADALAIIKKSCISRAGRSCRIWTDLNAMPQSDI